MLSGKVKLSGALLAAAGMGFAAAVVLASPAHAGPFSWLTGKNQQAQPAEEAAPVSFPSSAAGAIKAACATSPTLPLRLARATFRSTTRKPT